MRVVPSGADDVSDAIANALSISFEDAERIKNQIGLQNVTGDERLEKLRKSFVKPQRSSSSVFAIR